ncbi:ubiquitin carboxyl-terminal hydrolase CYLD-like [Ostrea edulis]|uniref:ubiquitin carboxyl-terminal hydrolase CYLD-like n=1 Tax=Ostrea edulis TaxID=37623 RepID=UPI0024AF90A1|nr:ubiquitin carboxyl-terminal hydrolase CYLD-like [Ostrea edulis]
MSDQNDNVYYILLADKIGKKKERGILRTTSSKVDVLPGTLLLLVEERNDKQRNTLWWTLETLEPENIEIECQPPDTGQLSKTEFALLQPIPVCQERLSIFQDQEWLKEGAHLQLNDPVTVAVKGQPYLKGLIKYKGELPGVKGIQFGIELLGESKGKGTCDGVFRKKRFFTCEQNSAIFAAIHKVRKDQDSVYRRQYPDRSIPIHDDLPLYREEREVIENSNLKEKDRIVWISDNGPEFGEVKWVGILPDSNRRDVTVGVEFDNPVGSGTGKYKNHRLFYAKAQHASLVPIMGLMKADEYMQMNQGAVASSPYYQQDYDFIHDPEQINSPRLPQSRGAPNSSSSFNPVKREILSQPVQSSDRGSYSSSNTYQQVLSKEQLQVHLPPAPNKEKLPPSPQELIPPIRQMKEERSSEMGGPNPLYEYTRAQDQQIEIKMEPFEQPNSRRSNPSSRSTVPADPDLEVGSMVEVMSNPPLYGVIRWMGYLPDQKEPVKPIAGLEMEEEISAGTDGSFGKHRFFSCPPKKAFFVPLYKCRKDKRFVDSARRNSGVSNNFGSMETPDVMGNISPPDSLNMKQIEQEVCGKQKGIQGHHNSCYLDATLLAMFYFTTVFDGILYRPKRIDDLYEYDEVKQVIKEGIVNPLRRHNYVRADKVMKLRHLLDKLGNIPGMMSEEKDPEEFLNLLLNQITKADPFLHIRSDNGAGSQHSFLYQLIMEKDERLVLPTTQQLFELSFLQMKVKLEERPPCLILQMPRFGKDYKMYRRIVPSLELDITDVLQNAPRECIICGDLAAFECKECYNQHGAGLNTIAFCEGCKDMSHKHKVRINHNWESIAVPQDYRVIHNEQKQIQKQNPTIPREKMELFAVVCIQTSHYVSFVKCGKGKDAQWIFFDSMADRMGEQSGYNIPEVKLCPDLSKWLSDDYQEEIMRRSEDKELPEHIRRLLCDAYMCMYQSPEVSMVR